MAVGSDTRETEPLGPRGPYEEDLLLTIAPGAARNDQMRHLA